MAKRQIAVSKRSAAVAARKQARKKAYGRTASGKPITDDLVESLVEKAEAGFDVEETLRRRRGRPPIGSGKAVVTTFRLDPELNVALGRRAKRDAVARSSVIRKALQQYLDPEMPK